MGHEEQTDVTLPDRRLLQIEYSDRIDWIDWMDVFGLGQCSLDTIGRIAAWPSPDSKCEFGGMVIQGGGPVATALVALSRWGLACHFAGVVGDDPFGQEISRFLRDEGIDTSGLVDEAGAPFSVCLYRFGARGKANDLLAETDGRGAQTRGDRFSHPPRIPGFSHRRALHRCGPCGCLRGKAKGVAVIVDAGTLRDGMLELARLSDCFVASESFAHSLVGDGRSPGGLQEDPRTRPGDCRSDPGREGLRGPVRRSIHREARLRSRGRRYDGLWRRLPCRPDLRVSSWLGPRAKLRSCRVGRGAGGEKDGWPRGDPVKTRSAGQGV